MRIMPSGDYYLWDCDWCDSLNRTLWTRIDEGKLVCGVCFASYRISECGPDAENGSDAFPNEMPSVEHRGAAPDSDRR